MPFQDTQPGYMGGFMGDDGKKKSPFSNKLSDSLLKTTPGRDYSPYTTKDKFDLPSTSVFGKEPSDEFKIDEYESLSNFHGNDLDLSNLEMPSEPAIPNYIEDDYYPTKLPSLEETEYYEADEIAGRSRDLIQAKTLVPAFFGPYTHDIGMQLQEEYDVTATPGSDMYMHTTNFEDQVSPYYNKVPGGFDRAVEEAQDRLSKRSPVEEQLLQGYPKWDEEDLDNPIDIYSYKTPEGLVGKEGQYGGYYRQPHTLPWGSTIMPETITMGTGEEFPNSENIQESLPQMMSLNRPSRDFGMPNPYAKETYENYQDMVHPYWPATKATLDHELTHDLMVMPAYEQYGREIPMQPAAMPPEYLDYYESDESKDWAKDYWDYATNPVEMEPRIAEIKRAFAGKFGRLPSNLQEAEEAWEWWKEQAKETGVIGTWSWSMIEHADKNKKLLQEILHRMLEVVSAPTTEPGTYA